MKDSNLTISIQVDSDNNLPVVVNKVIVNGMEFLPVDANSSPIESHQIRSVWSEAPVSAVVLMQNESAAVPEISENSVAERLPTSLAADGNTLEEFGGNDFYYTFFGKLTYRSLGNGTSRVTYQGQDSPFNEKYVGKWLEPSRVHRCKIEFPISGRNYFPGALSVVYSRILSVEDGKNLLVDFEYNGGDRSSPRELKDQDGTFFHDNKFALETWANSAKRKNMLFAKPGQIYGVLGVPKIVVKPNSELNFKSTGEGLRPAIHWMFSDAFDGDPNGRGQQVPGSFRDTFGDNSVFFHLPGDGRVDIDFDWQLLPPTYSHRVVQYGAPIGSIFLDESHSSTQFGLKRVANFDQFRIRKLMEKELGFVRAGAIFSMPSQGYCNGGGVHDGIDIRDFCTYRFEGDWVSKNPNNMKARTNGGLQIEWIGHSREKVGKFIEQESAKASKFEGLKFRFNSNREVEIDHPDFNWYHLASQEWTGGSSTGAELTYLNIDGKTIGLSTNGDFWLTNGDEDLQGRGFSADKLNLFDKIPSPGDVLAVDKINLKNCGLIGKVSGTEFEIWGWNIQPGDELSNQGRKFQVVKTERKSKTWEKFSNDLGLAGSINRSDRRVNYTLVTLDIGLDTAISDVIFKVEKSGLAQLLDGKYRFNCSAQWDLGNDAPGHLMYTDSNVNLYMKNVAICGLIRSTARSLWAEVAADLQGNITSIPVVAMRDKLWNQGDKLILFDPKTGRKVDLEAAAVNAVGGTTVAVNTTELPGVFSKGSILVAMFSLCSKAEFDHVSFVKEDGSPSYANRIDYRPQGLRLRQLIQNDNRCRVKIRGGRLSWFSNLENQFEPEIEILERPHMVNPKGAVPVLLNPVMGDQNGAIFGFQFKESGKEELFVTYRILARDREIDLINSVLGADLYLSGNGKFLLDNLSTYHFTENGRDSGVGFNLVFEEKIDYTTKLEGIGKGGKVGLMINSPFKVGVLKLNLEQWKLKPGLFNGGGFQTLQNSGDPDYSKYVSIHE